MKEGLYLGPGGQIIELQNNCLIFGMFVAYENILGKHWDLQLQYVCRQEKYILSGFEYIGVL